MTKLLAILIALVASACSGPIGLGTTANLTETVCVIPSGVQDEPGAVTVRDIADAAAVWHAADARVNMTVRAYDDGPREECDTVVSAKDLDVTVCGATTMTGEHIYLDLTFCNPRTVEPHELGHLLLDGDHSTNPDDLMFAWSSAYAPAPGDLARLDAMISANQ